MKEVINCAIPIRFPLKTNLNGICFTKESLKNIKENLKNAPIIENEKAVGVLIDTIYTIEKENEVIIYADADLFLEVNPKIIETIVSRSDIKIIEGFRSFAISVK